MTGLVYRTYNGPGIDNLHRQGGFCFDSCQPPLHLGQHHRHLQHNENSNVQEGALDLRGFVMLKENKMTHAGSRQNHHHPNHHPHQFHAPRLLSALTPPHDHPLPPHHPHPHSYPARVKSTHLTRDYDSRGHEDHVKKEINPTLLSNPQDNENIKAVCKKDHLLQRRANKDKLASSTPSVLSTLQHRQKLQYPQHSSPLDAPKDGDEKEEKEVGDQVDEQDIAGRSSTPVEETKTHIYVDTSSTVSSSPSPLPMPSPGERRHSSPVVLDMSQADQGKILEMTSPGSNISTDNEDELTDNNSCGKSDSSAESPSFKSRRHSGSFSGSSAGVGEGADGVGGKEAGDILSVTTGNSEKKLYHCQHCKYTTDRKNNLKRHVITMHEVCTKPLECCDVVFKNKASLREHVISCHKNGYDCRVCGRTFCRKALLKRHITVHSGQKDYICGVCGYATSHKSNLDRHKRRHGPKFSSPDESGQNNSQSQPTHQNLSHPPHLSPLSSHLSSPSKPPAPSSTLIKPNPLDVCNLVNNHKNNTTINQHEYHPQQHQQHMQHYKSQQPNQHQFSNNFNNNHHNHQQNIHNHLRPHHLSHILHRPPPPPHLHHQQLHQHQQHNHHYLHSHKFVGFMSNRIYRPEPIKPELYQSHRERLFAGEHISDTHIGESVLMSATGNTASEEEKRLMFPFYQRYWPAKKNRSNGRHILPKRLLYTYRRDRRNKVSSAFTKKQNGGSAPDAKQDNNNDEVKDEINKSLRISDEKDCKNENICAVADEDFAKRTLTKRLFPSLYVCKRCSVVFENQLELLRHIDTKHRDDDCPQLPQRPLTLQARSRAW